MRSTDRIAKRDAIALECSAELIWRAELACAYGGAISTFAEPSDEWGTGTRRLRRQFARLGLHKFTTLHPDAAAARTL